MKLRIISDGSIQHTYVIDPSTGQKVENVSRIVIEMDAKQNVLKAEVTVIGLEVQAIVNADVKPHEG